MLDAAPKEVAGLLAALKAGDVDGSTYEGECACLVGTIANVRGCDFKSLPGLVPNGDRPAEKWFLAIREGDTPRNSQVCAIAAKWVEEWLSAHPEHVPVAKPSAEAVLREALAGAAGWEQRAREVLA